MTRDDELHALVAKVQEVFGGEAVRKALFRAVASSVPASPHVHDLMELMPAALKDSTKVVDGRAIKTAFKDELRRVLAPH